MWLGNVRQFIDPLTSSWQSSWWCPSVHVFVLAAITLSFWRSVVAGCGEFAIWSWTHPLSFNGQHFKRFLRKQSWWKSLLKCQNIFLSVPWIFIFQNLNSTQYVYIDSFSLIKKNNNNNNKSPKNLSLSYIYALSPVQTQLTYLESGFRGSKDLKRKVSITL